MEESTLPKRLDADAALHNGHANGHAPQLVPPAPALAEGPPRLAIEGICKRWGKQDVLVDVSLRLRPGMRVSVSGRNGAGKTTLLRIVSGLILPDRGRVALDGLDPDRDRTEYQRRVGLLSSGDRGLYARLTVEQNLDFWGRVAMLGKAQRRAAVATGIVRFQLAELAKRRVDRLSTGQRQRVRLAMAFLHEPQVLLLDEPHHSLDTDGVSALKDALAEFTARGGAAMWCLPDGDDAKLPHDAAYGVDDGSLVPR